MRILLSDGSGLTSRQVATILGNKGYEVHVLCPRGPSLTRLTRWVTKVHDVPPFGQDPYKWLRTLVEIISRYKIATVVCTQEQVAVLSAEAGQIRNLGVRIAVPPFLSLRMVMDKISAYETLTEIGLRQPESKVVSSVAELLACEELLPAYVKTPIGTASKGVKFAETASDLARITREYDSQGVFQNDGRLLIQRSAEGPLLMVQSVFRRGVLHSWHACVRTRQGPSGGATHKTSMPLPVIMIDLARLGSFCHWDGALSMDAILFNGKPHYIDVNPRLVEPMNALFSGVDLVETLLDVSTGSAEPSEPVSQYAQPQVVESKTSVKSHQFVLAVMKAAEEGRWAVILEVFNALLYRNEYRGSREELTPIQGGRSLVKYLDRGSVSNYALTPSGWATIIDTRENKRTR